MTCATCPHFSAIDTPFTTCRAKPAGVYSIHMGEGKMAQSAFPPTYAHLWCAEHPERKRRGGLSLVGPSDEIAKG